VRHENVKIDLNRHLLIFMSGLHLMRENQNLITTNLLVSIVQKIKQNQSGISVQPGTMNRKQITLFFNA